MKKIIVLGASGMLGHKIFETFSKSGEFEVYGTVSKESHISDFFVDYADKIISGVVADRLETVEKVISDIKPDVVINCIGIIKQNKDVPAKQSIVVNALFPHLVSELCNKYNFRLITIATDCVFDGQSGNYFEKDVPTCHDVYGMTKYLGEVVDNEKVLTLRTSIIGHELNSNLSLLDWFLGQEGVTKGYTKAIFSGFTTLEFSKLLAEKIIPDDSLWGLYHISVDPISKYDLLNTVAKIYQKSIEITPDDAVRIDRSLNSDLCRKMIDYWPPKWDKLITEMYNDFLESDFYKNKREKYEKNNKF